MSSTTHYAPGTPEWRQVRDWLAQHRTLRADLGQAGNLDQLGPVVLTYARALHDTPAQAPSPLPLPGSGAPGDSIVIASCAHGLRQSWIYGVEQRPAHAWTLASFAGSQSADCSQASDTP